MSKDIAGVKPEEIEKIIEDDDFEDSLWEDDDDYFEPCDHCDLPDACADFGCAIKTGVRKDYPIDGVF